MYTHIHCVTTNQPTSRFSWRARINAQDLADMLGWHPEGEPITRIVDTLQRGGGVETFTRKVPTSRGTDGVGYRFLPCTADTPLDLVPVVARVEVL